MLVAPRSSRPEACRTMENLHFARPVPRPRPGPLVALLVLVSAGCGSIGVRRTNAPDLFEAWGVSAGAEGISPRHPQKPGPRGLDGVCHQNPPATVGRVLKLSE